MKSYRADWTREEAEAELAKQLLKIEPAKTKGTGITLKGAVERYLVAKARKRTLAEDKRQLEALKTEFGPDTPVGDITASRISQYKDKRLSLVRTIGEGANAVERRLTNAAVNRPLALLRHLLRMAHEEWEVIDNVPRIRLEKEPQGRLRSVGLDTSSPPPDAQDVPRCRTTTWAGGPVGRSVPDVRFPSRGANYCSYF